MLCEIFYQKSLLVFQLYTRIVLHAYGTQDTVRGMFKLINIYYLLHKN